MRQLIISNSITEREFKSLDLYFNEVSKFELISVAEEVSLVEKIRQGNQEALEKLTNTNLRFVISVAKQYQNQGLSLGDLINEGNIGLMIAAKRYDETRGFKFISYAVWWIRQSIISAISEQARIVRLPYNCLSLSSRIYKATSKLEQDHCRQPTVEEISEMLEIPVERVAELQASSSKSISISEPLGSDGEQTILDVFHDRDSFPDDELIMESMAKEIAYSLRVLCKRERELLILFFGLGSKEPQSLTEIGHRMGITKEHVGRLKDKALDKLRCSSHASTLMSCFG